MKRSLLLLIPLLFLFKGCELFDLEMKKVTYLLESSRRYVYESNLQPGQSNSDDRTLSRSDFDIPSTADVKKFKIKNIWLSVIPEDDNICSEGSIIYGLFNTDEIFPFGLYENTFQISSVPINEFIINNAFNDNLANLRQKIEQAIIGDRTVILSYKFSCNQPVNSTHIVIVIRFTVDVEYINCEEVFSGSDLEDC